jgi:type I restriction-modification system DNA methylase subunit
MSDSATSRGTQLSRRRVRKLVAQEKIRPKDWSSSVDILIQPQSIRTPLLGCGYKAALLRSNFQFGQGQVAPIVGFAQAPLDSRSACVAVTSCAADSRSAADACRELGAPIVFVCAGNSLQWWKQASQSPEFLESIPGSDVGQFFLRRRDEFSPDAIYRAKTWGRFKTEYQLSFVDLGLMPLVEEQVGRSLENLIERNVSELKENLGLEDISAATGHWLLQTIFWLVSGKILHDKHVEAFEDLNLTNVEEVFSRLAAHYGAAPLTIHSRKEREGLQSAARVINRHSSLALTTTESLAYVYENALISRETRTKLGTHSTPSFLVDYVVGNLSDWIAEIPVDERSVFEPACGHAAFLVSAMRLLTELLPSERQTARKRGPYLRNRLHGSDIDSFALELARLSLTLTDIPNPDGWDLQAGDMFIGSGLAEQAKRGTILLANPPFDNFSPQEQTSYKKKHSELKFVNKSAEMLWRTLPNLRSGAVFGVVLPQSFLHNTNAKEARQMLLSRFELREICLFPDQIFSFSDAESVILLGRRKGADGENSVRYSRVRERGLPSFRSSYKASSTSLVRQSRFLDEQNRSLRVPDLEEIWNHIADNPKLGTVASTGQGFIFHGSALPEGSFTFSERKFPNGRAGFVHFDQGLQLHELPTEYWVNLDAAVIRRAVSGTVVGTPQVLLNYAPSSRGPWRLKALLDREGHPVSSRFITVRPTAPSYSILALWAVLNSPIANAYVFSNLGKRDNVVGDIRRMPMPPNASFKSLDEAAVGYLEAASSQAGIPELRELLMNVDMEVLRLYALPAKFERSLLNIFTGWERVGVPFRQVSYVPETFRADVSFGDFRKLEENWPRTNHERGLLIDKQISGDLTEVERARLELLQEYADYHVDQVAPRPVQDLEELERTLHSKRAAGGERH